MPKSKEISTTKAKRGSEKSRLRGLVSVILGLCIALLIASIAYSSTVIYLGTEGQTPLIMIAPQVIFALGVIVYALIKVSATIVNDK